MLTTIRQAVAGIVHLLPSMLITSAHAVATVIELISVAVIAWGVLLALWRIIALAFHKYVEDMDLTYHWLKLRRSFNEIMLLGLQFLVAADIILTICRPDVMTLGILAAIVLIRVVLSVSLAKEISELEERDEYAHKHWPPKYE